MIFSCVQPSNIKNVHITLGQLFFSSLSRSEMFTVFTVINTHTQYPTTQVHKVHGKVLICICSGGIPALCAKTAISCCSLVQLSLYSNWRFPGQVSLIRNIVSTSAISFENILCLQKKWKCFWSTWYKPSSSNGRFADLLIHIQTSGPLLVLKNNCIEKTNSVSDIHSWPNQNCVFQRLAQIYFFIFVNISPANIGMFAK